MRKQWLTDPSFETGAAEWNTSSRAVFSSDAAHTGNLGYSITGTEDGNVYPTLKNGWVAGLAGKTLYLGMWMRHSGSGSAGSDGRIGFVLQYTTASGGSNSTFNSVVYPDEGSIKNVADIPAEGWVFVTATTTVASDAAAARIAPWFARNASAMIYVDDMEMCTEEADDTTNLLPNPGAETGDTSGWLADAGTLTADASFMRQMVGATGKYQFRFTSDTAYLTGYTVGAMNAATVSPVTAGSEVAFSGRMWMDEAVNLRVCLEFANVSGSVLTEVRGPAVRAGWYAGGDFSFAAEAPAGAATVRVGLSFGAIADVAAGKRIWLDNLALRVTAPVEEEEDPSDPSGDGEETPEPPRPAPMDPDATTVPTYSRVGRLPWDRDPWVLEYPGTRLEFGTLGSGIVLDAAPDYGTREFTTEDQPVPRADGRTFGQDFLNGSTISFELAVHGKDEQECRQRLAAISRAWRGDAIRKKPGEVAELHSDTGRVVYGRPRRFAFDGTELPLGVALVTCDFETTDDYWYDAEEKLAAITFYPDLGGGLVAPLTAPLSTTLTSDRSRPFTVGGESETWPVFEVWGPITTPVLEIVDRLEIEIQTTLLDGEVLRIDTRPHARSVLRNNGVSNAGLITRKSTRLSDCALAPGTYELVLRGQSGMRDATAAIRWREAYAV